MNRIICLLSLVLIVLTGQGLYGNSIRTYGAGESVMVAQDSIDKQILYNGRIWRNNYLNISGNQFLFSNEFLPGSVTIDGKVFNGRNLRLKLNIFDDELLAVTSTGTVLQLNKEMIENFTLEFENKTYNFRNLPADSLNSLSGFVRVMYDGATPLYVRYKKEIRLRSSVEESDMFLQSYRIYLMKDGILHKVINKKSLVRVLAGRKDEVKNYIRSNHIRISKNLPESFAPVLKFYDSLR